VTRRGVLALLPLALASTLAAQDSATVKRRTVYDDLQMFSQVLNQIRVNHPDSVDTHELFLAAIEAMVRAADPHSFVLVASKDSSRKAERYRQGKLDPVPIEFEFVSGSPVVVSVAPGSAAAALDILPGDELVAADSQPVKAEGPEDLAIELAGPKKSTVLLRLDRRRLDGSLATLERAVRRQRVEDEVMGVAGAFLLDDRTGYLRITTFQSERVADDTRAALATLETQGMQRLVLDLRDNGGGAVTQAAAVAGEFLPVGTVVYMSEGRKKELNDTVKVKRSFWKREKRYPLVVLVNNGTASASELLAGALQDHDRGLIVGRPTFGKSLIMQAFPLADGSIIELVIARFRTPCGRIVQRAYRGVTTREYYRLSAVARDTAGLPSCQTDAGRVVYGGGGVLPDVSFPPGAGRPLWLARVYEQDLPLQWVGAYVTAHRAELGQAQAFERNPVLAADALGQFRQFATGQGVEIPQGPEVDEAIRRLLIRQVAAVAFGQDAYYRIAARMDPQVAAAVASFDQAEAILTAAKQP
jgi:carboxyl-terminal processing protease